MYLKIRYFFSLLYNVQTKDATGCKNLEAENVTVKTSGETLYPNIAFLSFLILIFIPMISNSKFLNAMNGLFLGLFIEVCHMWELNFH